jgi:hypothetical protein
MTLSYEHFSFLDSFPIFVILPFCNTLMFTEPCEYLYWISWINILNCMHIFLSFDVFSIHWFSYIRCIFFFVHVFSIHWPFCSWIFWSLTFLFMNFRSLTFVHWFLFMNFLFIDLFAHGFLIHSLMFTDFSFFEFTSVNPMTCFSSTLIHSLHFNYYVSF